MATKTRLAPPVDAPLSQSVHGNGHPRLPSDDVPNVLAGSEEGRRVSEAAYWAHYYQHADFAYEWNNGRLEVKPVADIRNAEMYRWFLKLLEAYLEVFAIAKIANLEIGFRLALPDRTSARVPDLFVVRNDNEVPLNPDDRKYSGICDLCVESASDSSKKELERDTKVKKAEYEGLGVREYYILHTDKQNLAFYQRTADGRYESIAHGDDGVIRSTVLPGFQFRIDDLFRQPTLIELAEEPIYQDFVLPEYQAQKARADRLAAKLRELGIDESEL